MDLQVPPELEADLFTAEQVLPLRLGAAQNLAQEAYQKLIEELRAIVSVQKQELLPRFEELEKTIFSNNSELTRIQEENVSLSQRLSQQENILEEHRQRLATQENTLGSYWGIFDLFQKSTDTINATDDQQKELAKTVDSLKKTLLANNAAWEKSFTNIENVVKKESTERSIISQKIEANGQTLTKLESKFTRLECQHTFLKWIGGGVILALMVWIWSHHNS